MESTAIIAVAAVVVGWLLNELSFSFRKLGDKRILRKRVLYKMLQLHAEFRIDKGRLETTRALLDVSSGQYDLEKVRTLEHEALEGMSGLKERLHETLIEYGQVDPVAASRIEGIFHAHAIFRTAQKPDQLRENVSNDHVYEPMKKTYEHLINKVSESARGLVPWYDVLLKCKLNQFLLQADSTSKEIAERFAASSSCTSSPDKG